MSTMTCWSCDTPFDFGEDVINYCPACGKRQIQKCSYCTEDISCLENECPHCGRMFARCDKCNIAYSLDETRCKEEDCKSETVHYCEIFQWSGVNASRGNCFVVNNNIEFEPYNKTLDLQGKISPVVICNSNMVFWKNINNRCRIFCINLKTNKNAWESTSVETINLPIDDIRNIEVNEVYVLTFLSDRLVVNALTDGRVVSILSINSEYKASMLNRRLFILRKEARIQKLDVYEYPYITPHSTSSSPMLGKEKNFRSLPVIANKNIYFVDFLGNIIRINAETLQQESIYSNKDDLEIEFTMNHGNYLLLTQKYSDGNRSISKIELSSSPYGFIVTPIITNMNLASPKFSAHGNYVYICENMSNTQRFSKYPIIGFSGVAENHKNANTEAVLDFYTIAVNKNIYIVFKCKSRTNNSIEIRKMDFQTGDYGSGLRSTFPNSPVCVVNVYDKILITELKDGIVYIK